MATAKKTKPAAEPKPAPASAAPAVVESTELVLVDASKPAEIFTTAKITALIGEVEKLKNDFLAKCDSSTKKGQAEIISFAARIRKTRKLIDEEIGQTYVAVLKDEPKRIDALRKQFRDTLDLWAVEVRKPVTEMEEKEESRKAAHDKAIAEIGAQIQFVAGQKVTSAEIQRRIDVVATFAGRGWEEYQELYENTAKGVNEKLGDSLVTIKKAEDDAAELERLKKEAADRAEKDRLEAAKETARLAGIEEGKKQAAADAAKAAAPAPQPEPVTQKETQDHRNMSTVSNTPAAPTSQTMGYGAGAKPRTAEDEAKAKIHREIVASLVAYGTTEAGAVNLVKEIVKGKIAHVFIKYEA